MFDFINLALVSTWPHSNSFRFLLHESGKYALQQLKVQHLWTVCLKVFFFFFVPDWFYHAPSQKTSTSAKPAPPASQIPGIGGLKDEFANPEQDDRHFRRKWIRDTDSKYIKLAKAGGRKNLLAFRSPPIKADEPVPYPRVDWFDHDLPEHEDSHELQCTVKQEEQHKKPNPG